MIVTPVINMAGQCEEAIRYYEDVFSTKADFILRYSDADPDDWKATLSEAQQQYVYHAEMRIGSQRFMFSDIIEFNIERGNNFFVVLTFDTKEEVEQVYNRLLPGSKVLDPLHSTTYSSAVANLIDPFGIRWGLMTEQTEK
ncbi:MAG TPA: VOC family protein [Anaerolineaceae bacterium]|nr:VOC family protein [Anaerolineaceae bacterium]